MLKTGAHLCQSVADPTPLGRIVSAVYGQARQGLGKVFRRVERSDRQAFAKVVESAVPAARSRGLLATVRHGSRSLLSNFVAKNYQSELVTAMKQRYPFRLTTRRLPGYAFVGIGVAAGTQWSADSDSTEKVEYESLFKQIYDMTGRYAKVTKENKENDARTLPAEGEWLFDYQLDENADVAIEDEEEKFDFIVIDKEESSESDIVILSESTNNSFSHVEEQKQDLEIGQNQLLREITAALTVADEHHASLEAVGEHILILNSLLKELTAGLPQDNIEPNTVEETSSTEVLEEIPSNALDSCLILADQQHKQIRQLSSFVRQHSEQLQQLSLLANRNRQGSQPVVGCPHCNKDTCCGPGVCCGPGSPVD